MNEICFKFLSFFGLSSVVLDGMEPENVMIEGEGKGVRRVKKMKKSSFLVVGVPIAPQKIF